MDNLIPKQRAEARHDLVNDIDELLYLYGGLARALTDCKTRLSKAKRLLRSETFADISSRIVLEQQAVWECLQHLKKIGDVKDIAEQLVRLDASADGYRIHQSLVASLVTCMDWQSPSYKTSLWSYAGSQTGRIIGGINDYKRDQHLDAQTYEDAYRREFIDGVFKLPVQVYLTSSGMAAFSTVLNFLTMEHKAKGPVLAGSSVYFQNKELIQKTYRGQVTFLAERNTGEILDFIQDRKPTVLFFDSLCNAPGTLTPDLPQIIDCLIKHAKQDTYLVIDNTCLSVGFQPLPLLQGKFSHVRLLVCESLNKYHQFGTDRVTAGVIWGYGGDVGKIFTYRKNLGTNIPDASVAALPPPNREMLAKRLMRFERNTKEVAETLQKVVESKKSIVRRVAYPGFSEGWIKGLAFHGSFLTLEFQSKFATKRHYRGFIDKVIKIAKKRGVDIAAGTSFGFSKTRIYLVAPYTDYERPFVRISVGTENRLQLERLKDVLREAMI